MIEVTPGGIRKVRVTSSRGPHVLAYIVNKEELFFLINDGAK